jgi:hypothetical protein
VIKDITSALPMVGGKVAHGCGVHGHAHRNALTAPVDASDFMPFWGALGCSCLAL